MDHTLGPVDSALVAGFQPVLASSAIGILGMILIGFIILLGLIGVVLGRAMGTSSMPLRAQQTARVPRKLGMITAIRANRLYRRSLKRFDNGDYEKSRLMLKRAIDIICDGRVGATGIMTLAVYLPSCELLAHVELQLGRKNSAISVLREAIEVLESVAAIGPGSPGPLLEWKKRVDAFIARHA